MIVAFLRVRFRQLYRTAASFGAFYLLLLTGIAGFILKVFFEQLPVFPHDWYAGALLAAVIMSVHLNRRDKKFITLLLRYPFQLYFIEYFLFLLPLLGLFVFFDRWLVLSAVVFGILLIAFSRIEIAINPHHRWIGRLFPAQQYEWLSGVRRYYWLIVMLYGLAVGLSFIKYVSLFILMILMGVIASFYEEGEPLQFIEVQALSVRRFLMKKMIEHVRIYSLWFVPVLVFYTILNFETVWVVLFFWSWTLITMLYWIVLKYAVYRPQTRLVLHQILAALPFINLLMPFLLPVMMLVGWISYRKAVRNLENYLHA